MKTTRLQSEQSSNSCSVCPQFGFACGTATCCFVNREGVAKWLRPPPLTPLSRVWPMLTEKRSFVNTHNSQPSSPWKLEFVDCLKKFSFAFVLLLRLAALLGFFFCFFFNSFFCGFLHSSAFRFVFLASSQQQTTSSSSNRNRTSKWVRNSKVLFYGKTKKTLK